MSRIRISATHGRVSPEIQKTASVMKQLTKVGLVLVLTSFALITYAKLSAAPAASAPPKAISISGTQSATFNYGMMSWDGTNLISFGGQPAKAAKAISGGGSVAVDANGMITGTEILTLVFKDGSGSFDMVCRFRGTPGSTPGLVHLHELGTVGNGTGDYAKISGTVVIQGTFLNPFPVWEDTVPSYVGQVDGSVSGISQ